MNRHQSNPFLSGWDDDDDDNNSNVAGQSQEQQQSSNSSSRKTSNPFSAQRSASTDKGKLYHRNMSSFEAASLQLEHHELLKKNIECSGDEQTELIARMTAEFESAIKPTNVDDDNDHHYDDDDDDGHANRNLNEINTIEGIFDPFETIVDDDVEQPAVVDSQTIATCDSTNNDELQQEQQVTVTAIQDGDGFNQTSKSFEKQVSDSSSSVLTQIECIPTTNKHDSIDDDDEEFVSTPVRNIKSETATTTTTTTTNTQNSEQFPHRSSLDCAKDLNTHLNNSIDSQGDHHSNIDNGSANNDGIVKAQDSMTKASMFASLIESAEGSNAVQMEQLQDLEANECNVNDDDALNTSQASGTQSCSKSPEGAHVISADNDRSVAFFDPFETVIDKDALSSFVNSQHDELDNDTNTDINLSANIIATNSSNTTNNNNTGTEYKFEDYVVDEADLPPPPLDDGFDETQNLDEDDDDDDDDYKRTPLPPKVPRPTPIHHPIRKDTSKPIATSSASKTKSASNKDKNKRKVEKDSNDDTNSDDDDDDDDRIQIVIKSQAADKSLQNVASSGLVPLLPPPPSKISIKQARERGKIDDIPSISISKYIKKHQDSDSDSDQQQNQSSQANDDESTLEQESPLEQQSKGEQSKISKLEDDNYDDDADGEEDDGAFVIRMTKDDRDELDGADLERPDSPLYDEDTSYTLEDFPQKCDSSGWHMMLRYPPKKNWASTRFWKNIYVKLTNIQLPTSGKQPQSSAADGNQAANSCVALQIFDKQDDKKPMQDIPIQPTYTISDISSQQFDQFGKIFTIKIQYIFYKERIGVRQGQLARFMHSNHIGLSTTSGGHGTDPISIGSLKHYGAPIEHAPQVSQIIKLGCHNYNDIRQFKNCLEDHLFKMSVSREKVLVPYKTEEVQMAVRDETYIEVNQVGVIVKQLARVRLFFLSFLNGTPTVEVGINDIHRQGREIVGRMDIMPVMTEEWIRIENCDLHSVVDKSEFEKPDSRLVKLVPPDATFFELMRFRVRPPRNRELPLQVSANMSVKRTKVCINVDVMVPGCTSRKHGQIPCEGIAIRVYIPECWIYFFREEKHFRMGSLKSVNRRAGKVKGIERFLGGGGNQDINDESSLIEVTSGQAKYEHHHHSIVWRAARWPKENQASYVQNSMKIRLPLAAHDVMPDSFYEYVHVEYSMLSTTVSHTTVRSISVNPCDDDRPPEKYVKYSAKFEYKVKMRLSINLASSKQNEGLNIAEKESSPIVLIKSQQQLNTDQLKREEDSDDDDDDEDNDDGDHHRNSESSENDDRLK